MVQLSTGETDQIELGNLRINPMHYVVTVGNEAVDVPFYEFELLRLLSREVDHIVHYDAICRALWNSAGQQERVRLGVAICRLRAKLKGSWPYRIETVRGRGYGLIAGHSEGARAWPGNQSATSGMY